MKRLCELVASVLKVAPDEIGPESGPITVSQWDSFHHVHIVVAVEKAFGVELSPDEIVTLLSVGEIADVLRQKGVPVD